MRKEEDHVKAGVRTDMDPQREGSGEKAAELGDSEQAAAERRGLNQV